ncbi:hypothetical protein HU200_054626 [Digitaria exilis]|uniref:Uncharacterized protein n=1 Tax=Digitaria exilis TaxID=1010633 RepID=A0A835AKK0_9POAL|nr:hypothetical protein HU200_054626 [Digitaria exilis]
MSLTSKHSLMFRVMESDIFNYCWYRKITDNQTHRFILRAHPDVILEKAKRSAKAALEHYNRRKNVWCSFYSVL